jgi:hypothetical protein
MEETTPPVVKTYFVPGPHGAVVAQRAEGADAEVHRRHPIEPGHPLGAAHAGVAPPRQAGRRRRGLARAEGPLAPAPDGAVQARRAGPPEARGHRAHPVNLRAPSGERVAHWRIDRRARPELPRHILARAPHAPVGPAAAVVRQKVDLPVAHAAVERRVPCVLPPRADPYESVPPVAAPHEPVRAEVHDPHRVVDPLERMRVEVAGSARGAATPPAPDRTVCAHRAHRRGPEGEVPHAVDARGHGLTRAGPVVWAAALLSDVRVAEEEAAVVPPAPHAAVAVSGAGRAVEGPAGHHLHHIAQARHGDRIVAAGEARHAQRAAGVVSAATHRAVAHARAGVHPRSRRNLDHTHRAVDGRTGRRAAIGHKRRRTILRRPTVPDTHHAAVRARPADTLNGLRAACCQRQHEAPHAARGGAARHTSHAHSTVTVLARLRGWSTSVPR